jgi:hypothetical protein
MVSFTDFHCLLLEKLKAKRQVMYNYVQMRELLFIFVEYFNLFPILKTPFKILLNH